METICMKCQILFSGKKYRQFVFCSISPESGIYWTCMVLRFIKSSAEVALWSSVFDCLSVISIVIQCVKKSTREIKVLVFFRINLNYLHLPPDLALRWTLCGSIYPCPEQVSIVLKMFESLKFNCIMSLHHNFNHLFCILKQIKCVRT